MPLHSRSYLASHWADPGSLSRLGRITFEIESRDRGETREPTVIWCVLNVDMIFVKLEKKQHPLLEWKLIRRDEKQSKCGRSSSSLQQVPKWRKFCKRVCPIRWRNWALCIPPWLPCSISSAESRGVVIPGKTVWRLVFLWLPHSDFGAIFDSFLFYDSLSCADFRADILLGEWCDPIVRDVTGVHAGQRTNGGTWRAGHAATGGWTVPVRKWHRRRHYSDWGWIGLDHW